MSFSGSLKLLKGMKSGGNLGEEAGRRTLPLLKQWFKHLEGAWETLHSRCAVLPVTDPACLGLAARHWGPAPGAPAYSPGIGDSDVAPEGCARRGQMEAPQRSGQSQGGALREPDLAAVRGLPFCAQGGGPLSPHSLGCGGWKRADAEVADSPVGCQRWWEAHMFSSSL